MGRGGAMGGAMGRSIWRGGATGRRNYAEERMITNYLHT